MLLGFLFSLLLWLRRRWSDGWQWWRNKGRAVRNLEITYLEQSSTGVNKYSPVLQAGDSSLLGPEGIVFTNERLLSALRCDIGRIGV
jgi:hypothetical protein